MSKVFRSQLFNLPINPKCGEGGKRKKNTKISSAARSQTLTCCACVRVSFGKGRASSNFPRQDVGVFWLTGPFFLVYWDLDV